MSADSGGLRSLGVASAAELPQRWPSSVGGSRRSDVCRKRDFEIACAKPVESKAVVSALLSLVNPPQLLEGIQQINNQKYIVSFKTPAGAEYFRALAPTLAIQGTSVACKWLGAEFKRIKVAFLPLAVPNDQLIATLQKYGHVIQVTEELYQNAPFPLKTGTRFVDMEMITPVPNLISVGSFTVPATYKGVVMQCRRCLLTGHIKSECKTPYCDRCRSFGHGEDSCGAPCLKCKMAGHHWRECTVRSYAFATAVATAEPAEGASPATLAVDGSCSPYQIQSAANGAADGCQMAPGSSGPAATVSSAATLESSAMAAVSDDVTSVDLTTHAALTCKEAGVFEIAPRCKLTASGAGQMAPASGNTAAPVAMAATLDTSAMDTDSDDVTSFHMQPQAVSAFKEAAVSENSSICKESASDGSCAAPAIRAELPDKGKATAEAEEYSSGTVNERIAPSHLEWKMAITRSKRKLLAGSSGTSPAIKKPTHKTV